MDYKIGKKIEYCINELEDVIGYEYEPTPVDKIDIVRLVKIVSEVRDDLKKIIGDRY